MACHAEIKDPLQEKIFQTWKNSVHERQEESYHSCHGGNVATDIMEESTFPFIVDIVNFNQAGRDFKEFVYTNEEILWL